MLILSMFNFGLKSFSLRLFYFIVALLFANQGSAQFGNAEMLVPEAFGSSEIYWVDFDNNGVLDALREENDMIILHSFSSSLVVTIDTIYSSSFVGSEVYFTDFDLDGNIDFIGKFGGNSAQAFLNNGEGSFYDGEPLFSASENDFYPDVTTYFTKSWMDVGDIDNDGDDDIVYYTNYDIPSLGYGQSWLGVCLNENGVFGDMNWELRGGETITWYGGTMNLGFINDDPWMDFMLRVSQLKPYVGDGLGDFEEQSIIGSTGCQWCAHGLELNGDGYLDALYDANCGSTWVAMNDGAGEFGEPQQLWEDSTCPVIYPADWNFDGSMDLISSSGNFRNENGSYVSDDSLDEFLECGSRRAYYEDIDQDGDVDLLVQGSDCLYWFPNLTFLFGDLNDDQDVNISDVLMLLENFGNTDVESIDLNNDGIVNVFDLLIILGLV